MVTNLGEKTDEELVDLLKQYDQVLCIVNTRKHAQLLFNTLSKMGKVYHLSAKMCPVHRRKILNEIRINLKNGTDCRVISTQLIEAGVDVDFPVVFRAVTGIDSIAQASGRCNREGKQPMGHVFLFSSSEKYGKPTSWQRKVAVIGEIVMESHDDPLSLPAIDEYFQKLYFYEGDDGLDQKKILSSFEEGKKDLAFPFEEVSQSYKLIEENTRDLIVPYDKNAETAIENIRKIGFPGESARKLQGYIVSIYHQEFLELEKSGVIETIGERFHILVNPRLYDEHIGLVRISEDDEFGGLLIA
jgi:CRISPR-associated endonuclease/helicase Cas3